MNIRHVQLSKWSSMSMASYCTALVMGFYGRSRIKFSSDFTYNKYHFACFCQVISGAGLMLSSKMKNPMLCGVFFLSNIVNLCLPSYYEGIKDMRNDPIEKDTSLQRKIGTYSMIIGLAIIWKKY